MQENQTENLSTDAFKRATAIAVKAIGEKPALEVGFSALPGQDGDNRIALPEPPPKLDMAARDASRGFADAAALRLRHHNARLHAARAPQEGDARAAFDALERARCEALGARAMKGVAQNIAAMLDAECRSEDIGTAHGLHALAWEKLTGHILPSDASRAAAYVRPLAETRGAAHWEKLAALIGDQKAYAAEALRLIGDLGNDGQIEEDAGEEGEKKATPAEQEGQQDEQPDAQEGGAAQDQGEQNPEDDTEEGGKIGDAAPDIDMVAEDGDTPVENGGARAEDADAGPVTTYRAFTVQFDEIVTASDLCRADELTRLRTMLDRQVGPMQALVARLANRLQRRLMAQQARHWEFDLEEGLLDASRLARVIVSPTHALSYKREKPMDFRDTVVTLLIDNSGSMRGRPIT
ncbi:MAG: cobaltochelatase subunit CobT, partial [Alphaproteobacteria bacterium]|nr:cobaltochelatase subunit CobT [Alphaproteobacteria bacterium]